MIPVAWRLQLLSQKLVQLFAHLNDPPSHRLDVAFPFVKQLRAIEDQGDLQPRAVHPRGMKRAVTDARLVNHDRMRRRKGSTRTTRAPYAGGLLISLRVSTDSWLLTRADVSTVGATTCSAPTRSPYRPAFFAKLCHRAPSSVHPSARSVCPRRAPGRPAAAPPSGRTRAPPRHRCRGRRLRNLGRRSQRTRNGPWPKRRRKSGPTVPVRDRRRWGCARTRAGGPPTVRGEI